MRVVNRAEEYLSQYRTEDKEMRSTQCLLLAKDVLGWQPNGPHQLFWMDMLFRNLYTLLFSVPRGGKTMLVEVVDIYEMITNPLEDLCVYAPKLDQCKETLKYHYDWIDTSEILRAFCRKKNGKPNYSSVGYEFVNRSIAKCFSIGGELEGHNVSISRVEEFDDWTWERFANDIVRRMGAASKNGFDTRMRITGTIMGEENIFRILNDPKLREMFANLSQMPAMATPDNPLGLIDVHMLLAWGGILDESSIEFARNTMSPDEWARSYLLLFTESKNFIWRKHLRATQKLSLLWGLAHEPYDKGGTYKRKPGELIAVGFDCGHAGQKTDSSVYSLQVGCEVSMGRIRYIRWMNGFNWDATADTDQIVKDVVDILAYYRPDGGYGDALKHDMIMRINRMAYSRGITSKNVDDFPEQTPGNWDEWYIKPMWNDGKGKHEMYTATQMSIHHHETFFPYFDRKDDCREAKMCRKLVLQLEGIRATPNKGRVPSYAAENAKIGDDDADAWGMMNRYFAINAGVFVDYSQVRAFGQRVFGGDKTGF